MLFPTTKHNQLPMKKPLLSMFACGLLLGAGSTAGHAADPAKPAAVPSREKTVLVTITAAVEAIDQTTREVTLKGPLGNSVTFTASPQIERLNEVKVGD